MKRWTIQVAAVAAVCFFGLTGARGQLKRKRAEVKVSGKYKVRSKEALKKKHASKNIRAEEYMLAKIRRQVENIILKQRMILLRRLKYTPDSDPKYPEYLFRLASLNNELQDAYWMKAMGQNEEIFKAQEAKDFQKVRRLKDLQRRYFVAHQAWLKESLTTFLRITQKFQSYNRLDEVYFHISNTSKKLTERETDATRKQQWNTVMLTYFKKLLQQFPKSRYVPDALLAYAEHSFNTRQFGAAKALYERITTYKNSSVRPYAIWKIGWVYLNLKQHKEALDQFVKVLKERHSKLGLINEARKDIVRTFAHVGVPTAALRFFRRPDIGGVKNAKWMLIMLGDVLYSQGKNEDAITVYGESIRQWPRDKERCKWMLAIVDARINVGEKQKQVEAIQALGVVWKGMAKQFGLNRPVVMECKNSAANIMRLLATQWHKEAQKTKNWDTLYKTQFLYRTYIKSFPENPDIYIMRSQYADLLFLINEIHPEKANWPLTAEAFKKVVVAKKPPKMKMAEYITHRNNAALAMVECWMNHFKIKSAEDLAKPPKGKDKKVRVCAAKKGRRCIKWKMDYPKWCTEKVIPSDHQRMIEAYDLYIKFVPASKLLAKIKYNKALIYYNYGHCKKAMPFFMDIAMKHQSEEEAARYSALRIIHILKEEERYSEMRSYIDRFYQSPRLMADMSFKLKMQEFKRNAMWEDAEKLKQQKRYRACGELFRQIAVTYPQDVRLGDLYWNSSVCYEAAKLIGMAVKMRATLRRVRPNHAKAKEALYSIGRNYRELAFYNEAAETYEQFAKDHSKEKEAPQALKWAILLRWGTGNIRMMKKNVKQFIETFSRRGRKYASMVAEVHFWVHKIHEEAANENELIGHLSQYLSRYRKAGGLDREMEALAKLGQLYWKRSCKREMTDGMCIKVTFERRGKRRKRYARAKKKLRYLERASRGVRAARGRFQEVLRIWKNVSGPKGVRLARMPGKTKEEKEQRAAAAMHWVAMALFMLADVQFEAFMKLNIPSGLNFDPRRPSVAKRSTKKFQTWAEKKAKDLLKLKKQYEQVMVTRQAHWAIAATARIGMLYHNYARQLFSAPVPSFLKTDEEKNAYRDSLQGVADPLQNKAMESYTLCLKTARKYNWFNDWSKLCEKELNDLDATKFPLTMELRAQPGYVSTAVTPGNLMTKMR